MTEEHKARRLLELNHELRNFEAALLGARDKADEAYFRDRIAEKRADISRVEANGKG
jgi:hypothetical protein